MKKKNTFKTFALLIVSVGMVWLAVALKRGSVFPPRGLANGPQAIEQMRASSQSAGY